MALVDLSDPQAVIAALDEFDRLGRDAFLTKYHFGKSVRYYVRRDGKLYDIKAIAAAAHGFQFGAPLEPSNRYTSGAETTVPTLVRLGFDVVRRDTEEDTPDDLVPGERYSWDYLGRDVRLRGRMAQSDGWHG